MYYQGKKCKYGHDGVRYTSSGQCVICERERAVRNRKHRERHPDKFYMGVDCKYGHGGLRYSSNCQCVVCAKIRSKIPNIYKIWRFRKCNGTNEELVQFAQDGLLDDWFNWCKCDGAVDYYIKYM